MADVTETVEMATLDKEMAEEKVCITHIFFFFKKKKCTILIFDDLIIECVFKQF